MKSYLKRYLKEWFAIVIIVFGIHFLWQGLEILTVGELQPSIADSIIYFITTTSLYINYLAFKDYLSSELTIRGENSIRTFLDLTTKKDKTE